MRLLRKRIVTFPDKDDIFVFTLNTPTFPYILHKNMTEARKLKPKGKVIKK